MEVYSPYNLFLKNETNNSYNFDLKIRREGRRNIKCSMRRDKRDFWFASKNGQWVPDEEVILILNDLIDSGFDVEVWLSGVVQGIKYVFFMPILFDVNRLIKK